MEPRATYRIQFRESMDFARAAALAPYLAQLGISHFYASPVFEAVPGSTHGYDVTNFNTLEPSLGGAEEFAALTAALKAHGLGLILDFVPNHMGASPHNPWWLDVLEWGAQSTYAEHFDIDWQAPRLIVPALGSAYGVVLDNGELGLYFDVGDGGLSFTYYELKLPLTPPSYAQILAHLPDGGHEELARRFATATPETSPGLKAELAELAREPAFGSVLAAAIRQVSEDHALLHELHERQVWRLAHWRAARETLTYRRFFEISDLVGVRVEAGRVFDDVHKLLLELVAAGDVDGIRLDHVDGLADPKTYLMRLQEAIGHEAPFYLLVEKILEPGEDLRDDWPVAGTTGYEFIAALAGAFVDPDGEAAMDEGYHAFIGGEIDYGALVHDTKRHILARNLAGELDVLKEQARQLAESDPMTRDLGADTLRRAILEVAVAHPVYRTYVNVEGASEEDRALLAEIAASAKATREVEDEEAIDFVIRLMLLAFDTPEDQAVALEFAIRFQQTTGPLMAKALEDTMFYRYTRMIALNEVGGDPARFGAPPKAFHDEMARRRRRQPLGLSTTSTHDTKRGEDARARLYAISEMPQAWSQAVARWQQLNAPHRRELDSGPAPEPEIEWLFYQALAGAWPAHLNVADGAGLVELGERMTAYMLKVVREAKLRTTWTGTDDAYEDGVGGFVRDVLDGGRNGAFLTDFVPFCQPLFVAGALTGLAQTLVKLTAPGVPDIYQGGELWDLSLVDPDNRRPVDFEARQRGLADPEPGAAALVDGWRSGAIKLHLTRRVLDVRARMTRLFSTGGYRAVEIAGPRADRVLAFARDAGDAAAVVVVPRLAFDLLDGEARPLVPAARWESTRVILPTANGESVWHDMLFGRRIAAGEVALSDLLHDFPVAFLTRTES